MTQPAPIIPLTAKQKRLQRLTNGQAAKWRIKYVNASGTGILTGQAHFNRAG